MSSSAITPPTYMAAVLLGLFPPIMPFFLLLKWSYVHTYFSKKEALGHSSVLLTFFLSFFHFVSHAFHRLFHGKFPDFTLETAAKHLAHIWHSCPSES